MLNDDIYNAMVGQDFWELRFYALLNPAEVLSLYPMPPLRAICLGHFLEIKSLDNCFLDIKELKSDF